MSLSLRPLAHLSLMLAFAGALPATLAASDTDTPQQWDKDVGKVAPELIGEAWIGSPVSLAAVKGNTVVLAFWNADIPC